VVIATSKLMQRRNEVRKACKKKEKSKQKIRMKRLINLGQVLLYRSGPLHTHITSPTAFLWYFLYYSFQNLKSLFKMAF